MAAREFELEIAALSGTLGSIEKVIDLPKLRIAAKELELEINWEGKGINEIGSLNGKHIIRIDPIYFRPTEVENLLGDSTKAQKKLGWKPRISFKELIKEMLTEDIRLAKQEQIIKNNNL